jgi:hypothetical protein
MPHVKAAGYGSTIPDPNGKIETITRAWGKILARIKNKL